MLKKIVSVGAIGGLAIIMVIIASVFLLNEEVAEEYNEESYEEESLESEVLSNGLSIVLDPGHGGYDPGKVGINSALEKDVNLAIALLIEEKLFAMGYNVIMTRETDSSMKESGSDLGKVQDLDARVQMINNSEAEVAVSIHQNSYITEDVKGAQVFFYENSQEGEKAAAIMQSELLIVDPSNHRQMKGNDSYYLLKRTTIPTIIVECGFLSNREEADKLCNGEYQEALAIAIVSGIEKYVKSL